MKYRPDIRCHRRGVKRLTCTGVVLDSQLVYYVWIALVQNELGNSRVG